MAEKATSKAGANGSYSAVESFGFAAAEVRLYNAGTVPARVSWDGSTAAVRLLAGERRGPYVYEGGDKPTGFYVYGEGGTPTVHVEAASARRSMDGGAEMTVAVAAASITYGTSNVNDALVALEAGGSLLRRSFTVGHADLTDADGSETVADAEGALPAGAVLMGYRKRVATAFSGGGAAVVTVDVGFDGAGNSDVLDDGQTVFTGVAAETYGAGANALPTVRRSIGGLIPQATFDADVDVADLTAGGVTFDIYYMVPASDA